MSLILCIYFTIVILFNTSTICDDTSNSDYKVQNIQDNLDDSSNYLENRVDLNYDNIDTNSDNSGQKGYQPSESQKGGIIDKLKGVWNKILHPNEYDRATYIDTLNNFHDEIFNYLNEDKLPRSLQPENLQCNSSDPCNIQNSKQNQTTPPCKPGTPCGGGSTNLNQTTISCNTYLKNFTVDQLNYLKKFLKCMQIQHQNEAEEKAKCNEAQPAVKSECSKCGEAPTTTKKTPPATKSTTNKDKTKTKSDSGAHSHKINEPPLNHTVLSDADKAFFCSYNLYLNKLKFLAHLHHTVYQVGKKKLEPIDLNVVQKLIDEAKGSLQVVNESLNKCSTKDQSMPAVDSVNPEITFPFFNPYFTRKKRNFEERSDVDDDEQINEVVSNIVNQLGESDKFVKSGDSDYSKILGIKKTKRKGHKKKKKKRRKKKKNKINRESEDGAETPGKMPMNVNISNSINKFNADYNNLKFKVSPEQEEDINKFLKNINEPPQIFNFDIEQYLNPKLLDSVRDAPKLKSFYEFNDVEHHSYKRKPGEIYVFNENVADEPTAKSKRDLLTQRIKAISNKMRMDSFLDRQELNMEDTSKYSRSSDPPRYSVPLNLDQFKTDNDFIDKFYLLNDGNPNTINDVKPDKHSELDKINPIDIRIDLDLDKKFRDLKWETDRKFYADVIPDDSNKKSIDTSNSDEIKNDNEFILYK